MCIAVNFLLFYDAVPEENLLAPEEPDMVAVNFLQFYYYLYFCREMVFQREIVSLEICLDLFADCDDVQERFDHPYNSFLFYGVDAAGDFIPIKQLREKYNRPRHEVPSDPQDDEQRGDD